MGVFALFFVTFWAILVAEAIVAPFWKEQVEVWGDGRCG